jgi:hypothetical protein
MLACKAELHAPDGLDVPCAAKLSCVRRMALRGHALHGVSAQAVVCNVQWRGC